MKIKSLLNLAEAKVYLDTVDFDSILLQDFLKAEKIEAKIYDSTGKHNEYPVIEYSGSKASLKKLIHEFFGDDDLSDTIQESTGDFKKLRTYAKGPLTVDMFVDKDKQIWVSWKYEQKKFPNVNAATKFLEDKGYKLKDLYESGQVMGKMYGYEQLYKKADKEAKVVMSDEKHVVVHFSEMFKGAMDEYKEMDFKSLDDAEKFLSKDGWKKDSTWNVKSKKWEKVK
jgi:hypothetical protein